MSPALARRAEDKEVAMFYGVAYNPEHWPEERWPVDARMMQEAGIDGVRMAEFAWSKVEPREGEVDFDWLDRAVDLLGEHGIRTMMCTMSRTPPPWAFQKYPAIRNTLADGHVSNYGHRYTVCLNHPTLIELSQRIDRAVIERYAGHPHVVAWHIDNEIGAGNACYCAHCHRAFIAYLRDKYLSVENLNKKWGAHFWSSAFSSFEEVPLPVGVRFPSPSLALEYARFQSKVNVNFALWRYALIKELHPAAWVTTNFQGSRATHTDIFDLGQATDVYGTNLYPPRYTEFALDYCRGARGELIVLEQRAGQPHWEPATRPGWMRLWAWRSIAHGACGINFFRWRTCRWGQETYWHGVLPHSGRPNRRYRELAQMGHELRGVSALIDRTRPAARAAIVMSYESRWALDGVASANVLPPVFRNDALGVEEEAQAYHDALMGLNVTTDALDPREDLSTYRLVIAPRLYCVDASVAKNLRYFCRDGGILCLTPRSGVVDLYNVALDEPAPGPLREAAGVEVDDYGSLEGPLPLRVEEGGPAGVVEATAWADEIELAGARVLATYDAGWLKGWPAIAVHEYGRGKVVYVGTLLRGASLRALVAWLCAEAGVSPVMETPPGVRAYERAGEDVRLLFLINEGEEEQEVALSAGWQDAWTGEPCAGATLGPAGVRLFKGPAEAAP
jgi:beta-galactosidase